MDNPLPIFALLEQLKDDPSDYVRRSVANNLNDSESFEWLVYLFPLYH